MTQKVHELVDVDKKNPSEMREGRLKRTHKKEISQERHAEKKEISRKKTRQEQKRYLQKQYNPRERMNKEKGIRVAKMTTSSYLPQIL